MDIDAIGAAVEGSTGTPDTNKPVGTPNPAAGPGNVVDISDDTLVRGVPGFNEPVRYGDLYKRLQGDYTRKTQAAERERQQIAREKQEWAEKSSAERQRLEQLAQTLISRQSGPGNVPYQEDPLFKELASAQYIDGPKMGKFIQAIQEKGFTPIVKAFADRDQIIQGLYQQIVALDKQVKSLSQTHSGQEFEGKISKWLSDGGYPQEANQLAKELYLAYEGDDLDNEFPQIFERRWNEIQNLITTQQRQRVEAAKQQSRKLPGKGGQGTPGKPLGLRGNERARDIASSLWDAIQTEDQT